MKPLLILISLYTSLSFAQTEDKGYFKEHFNFVLGGVHHFQINHRYITEEKDYDDEVSDVVLVTNSHEINRTFSSGLEGGLEYKLSPKLGLSYYLQFSIWQQEEPGDGKFPTVFQTGLGFSYFPWKRVQIEPRVGYSTILTGKINEGLTYGLTTGFQVNKAETFQPLFLRLGFYYFQKREHTEHRPNYWGTPNDHTIRTDRFVQRYLSELSLLLKF